MIKTEDDPLDHSPPRGAGETNAAMAHVDRAVPEFGGIALRYGGFYGDPHDQLARMVRKRRYPVIGNGAGVASWIHLDDAAAATVLALDHDGPAIYNIVDDEPAATSEWLSVLADALGARPFLRVPAWVVRLIAGEDAVMGATQARERAMPGPSASSGGRSATQPGGWGSLPPTRAAMPPERKLGARQLAAQS
jgi:nucleoside-diphosphate-sugar epimerase